MDDEQMNQVATQMYYSLCIELVRICKGNEGKKFEELEEYDRIKEIWQLTDLLEKEYEIIR